MIQLIKKLSFVYKIVNVVVYLYILPNSSISFYNLHLYNTFYVNCIIYYFEFTAPVRVSFNHELFTYVEAYLLILFLHFLILYEYLQ